MPSDLALEGIRAAVMAVIVALLWRRGRSQQLNRQRGWRSIFIGFLLLFLGSLVDITDEFPGLARYGFIGDTWLQAVLEKMVGYLLGFLFVALGFIQWLPYLGEREAMRAQIEEAHDVLERRVSERTVELTDTNQRLEQEVEERRQAEHALRLAKREAERANAAKSAFLSNMSHELRTPLNSIIGFANVLLKNTDRELTEAQLDYLSRISGSGQHLLLLINQLLDLSKVEAGKVQPVVREVALGGLLEELLAEFELEFQRHDLELTSQVPDHLAPIETDPELLRQVLVNLLGNALKFTERGSVCVLVEAHPETGAPLRIDVIDTGVGVSPEHQGAIFEAFHQVRSTDSGPSTGTGLGLAISRELCQVLGYELSIESQEGEGSCFSVHLDAAAPDSQPGDGAAPAVTNAPG